MITHFVLEVKAIKPCPGGHSCNLIANGRKVAYIAPNVFEWANHRAMVDVLEFYGQTVGLDGVGPMQLEDGWMEKDAPSKKKLQMQEKAQENLAIWVSDCIRRHSEAKRIMEECKKTVLTGCMVNGRLSVTDMYKCPSSIGKGDNRRKLQEIIGDDHVILNGMKLEELVALMQSAP